MTFDRLMAEPQHLLLKCVSGSHAYNLALPSSDTDLKGVFVLPQNELYGMTYTPQVANASNDEVFYEVGRFIDLLCKNNPNIMELLNTPRESILYRHPLMDLIKPDAFLSKLCLDSFAGYAKTQMKKARGLNKKINRSFDKARRSVLDFCFVVQQRGTVPLVDWLANRQIRQEDCGLSALTHFRDAYHLYHGEEGAFRGIVSDPAANDVQLSSIPADQAPAGVLHFNKDAYSIYCREYKEYWEWVEERNDARYQSTLSHGQNYDAKNMMHTFRLLNMAEEIARFRQVRVHREDRDFLLRIRTGEFTFEQLMKQVEEKLEQIEQLFTTSDLPEAPNVDAAEELLVNIRREFY